MIYSENQLRQFPWLPKETILVVAAGSRAYGIDTETSDYDIRGLFIAPETFYLGFLYKAEQVELQGLENGEGCLYNLPRFFALAAESNPNIIEILYSKVFYSSVVGRMLIQYRDLFLSKKARFTFSGYAMAQLKRIESHRKWLLDPPTHQPTRSEFGLPESAVLSADIMGAIKALGTPKTLSKKLREGITVNLQPDLPPIPLSERFSSQVMEAYAKERAFHNKMKEWESYLNWKKNRNPARSEVERKFGYDCYSEDTEFLTRRGWLAFDDISQEDELATVYIGPNYPHRQTLSLEYQKYTDKFDSVFTGQMYNLFGNHTDILVTPNHRMLIKKLERRSKKESSWSLTEAAHLPDTFHVLRSINPRRRVFQLPKLALPIPLNTYLRVMGWYLSDGCWAKQNKHGSIRISQKPGGRLHGSMVKFYRKYKENLSVGLYRYTKKPNEFNKVEHDEIILHIRDKEIAALLLKDCGKTNSKRIPRWVFSLGKRQMSILYQAMHRGDGTARRHKTVPDSKIYYTNLKSLANDVQELALLCGWESTLYGPYNHDIYQVHIQENRDSVRTLIRHQAVRKMPENTQRIVCFTVPNNTLVTRRNGKIGIHGNCKHAMHLIRLMRMCEEILSGKGVIVRRPDREELLAVRSGAWKYDDLIQFAADMDEKCGKLYETSTLPREPPRQALHDICVSLVSQAIR